MSVYFFNYETGGKDNEKKLSAEQLLTIFNRNIVKNAELLDYLGKKNIFEIIAKARNESMHSRFIAELLSGMIFNGDSRESTLALARPCSNAATLTRSLWCMCVRSSSNFLDCRMPSQSFHTQNRTFHTEFMNMLCRVEI